jgi:N12 class adenine-specific DNA methylase
LPLHDFFIARSLDAVRPGGILALVTSHFTLDKQDAAAREDLAARADFLGAIRLPSDAFRREGTRVVTDIVFLRKRAPDEPARHADPHWLESMPVDIDGASIPINRYFLDHPDQVLGRYSRKDRLYAAGYGVESTGDLAPQLATAIRVLPESAAAPATAGKGRGGEPIPVFVPPPLERHVTEGSFFVGDDQVIRQLEEGRPVPVTHGGTPLKSDGAMTGKRLAALIGLRDQARQVLRSQNEGWPSSARDAARRDLNRAYDLFVSQYGPINTTTFSETGDGGLVRRMPNLVKFREDPDAMLVMSLEEYDDLAGKATKAPVMRRDVVGRTPEVTSVSTAEEGLLVSLDRKGCVDLPFIARLYGKTPDAIIEELGELIYRDPHAGRWQTADEYLSGDVREKLVAAEAAGPGYRRNAEALRAVQPEDVLPGDIDANLGAPWIPTTDIRDFAAQLFGVAAPTIEVGHLVKDAVWSLEAGYQAEQSVAATGEYGTPRISGITLLEQALNLKAPAIYDTIQGANGEERVLHQEATLAAREKQKRIKDAFKAWTFADPDRTERLVRIYNDTYNNLRPRRFDGSHLDFPGMSEAIHLNPHQADAVWRGMSGGNTLLAHAVGAGKTFTMAATGMKMKQAGLIQKPVYVVPNHMLEQFAREFMQLYPDARLLVATKDDLAKDRRKLLTAKIAGGEWDGIVMTHSSFERVGMSRDFQATFLREQIEEYEELLTGAARGDQTRGRRNIIKTLEKQKARRQERLKDLLAEGKKDDGLVFDELAAAGW